MSDSRSTLSGMRPPPRSRKRKACERCYRRKQRCDGKTPTCQNCAASGSQCIPATRETMEFYPVRYIKSLEKQVAELRDHQGQGEQPRSPSAPIESNLSPAADQLQPALPLSDVTASPLRIVANAMSLSPILRFNGTPHNDGFMPDINFLGDLEAPIAIQSASTSPAAALRLNVASTPEQHSPSQPKPISISVSDAARHFLTYFEIIHPRYPFLEVEECSQAYLAWKENPTQVGGVQNSWHLFLATMILGIGSYVEKNYNNRARRAQHNMLMSRVHESQGFLSNLAASPLIRLQAMLLHVMLASLADNTSRLVHLVGVAMRFATLHGLHRLKHDVLDGDLDHKIRVWSTLYSIDRMVDGTFRIPPSLADEFISTPLYSIDTSIPWSMPWMSWLPDCPDRGHQLEGLLDLRIFAHMCRFRHIQSRIISSAARLKRREDINAFKTTTQREIDDWGNEEAFYRENPNGEGHYSPMWMIRGCEVLEVQLQSSFEGDLSDPDTVKALLNACCGTCCHFRTLQKTWQLTSQWVDTVFEFQAGVTVLYLVWRKQAPYLQNAQRAIRSCRSNMTIFSADAPIVESFTETIDNLEVLISSGRGDEREPDESVVEVLQELQLHVEKVKEAMIAPHIMDMLLEMCQSSAVS